MRGVSRGRLLDRCSLTVPVGMRLLVVSQPAESASELIRVMAGLSPASAGRIEIAGLSDRSHHGWGRRVAHLGPQPGIHRWMTPREALALSAALLDVAPEEATRRIERALAWVGIGPDASDRPVARGGPPLYQRTGLAAALIADPEVLLLDDPLRALDTLERTRLLRLPGRRHTIVIASRYPAAEAGLVSHVALMREGRLAVIAPIADLSNAGLPMSMRGITALADARQAARAEARPRATAATS
jgi:ABC-2 type transport system ATP-binding protein